MVSRSNYMEYINLVAHYKLNVQLHRQYQRFREGLEQVIPAQWLRLFSQSELQVLISGAQVPIDVTDLRSHTTYKGRGVHNADVNMMMSCCISSHQVQICNNLDGIRSIHTNYELLWIELAFFFTPHSFFISWSIDLLVFIELNRC